MAAFAEPEWLYDHLRAGPPRNWPNPTEWEEGFDLTEADDAYAEIHTPTTRRGTERLRRPRAGALERRGADSSRRGFVALLQLRRHARKGRRGRVDVRGA